MSRVKGKKLARKGFFELKGSVFPTDVLVCLGKTEQEITEYITDVFDYALSDEEKTDLKPSKAWQGRTVLMEGNWIVMMLKHHPANASGFAILAHEIFHATDMMLRIRSIKLSNDSDEVWAYQIQWLTKEIYRHFKFIT